MGKNSAALISPMMRRIFPWLGAICFLSIFFFLPLVMIFSLGINLNSTVDQWRNAVDLAGSTLGFTTYQAVLSTVLTLLVGLPGAYLFSHYEFPGKKWLKPLTSVPFLLPTVVVAAGFSSLIGPSGWINQGLMHLFKLDSPPLQIQYSLISILLAHVFYNTTIILRLVGDSWSQLDTRLPQAARVMGASPKATFFKVTWPLLRPSILAATMLVFLFDFNSFGVILLLGGPKFSTLEVEIYKQALHMLNLPMATQLSIVQFTCTLAFSFLYSRLIKKVRVTHAPAQTKLKKAGTWREYFFVGFSLVILLSLFVLPMLALPVRSLVRLEAGMGQRANVVTGVTLEYYRALFINQQGSIFYIPPLFALRNSLIYAFTTVVISLVLGFPVATALVRPGRIAKSLDSFLWLPLGASAVTLGLGYILAFSKPPFNYLGSPWLVPLAHSTIALPFVIRSLQPALAAIPDDYRRAAALLGASPARTWFSVDFPIIRRAILSAGMFSFIISMGEFGATSVLSRPDFPTIPMAIFRFLSQPGGLNFGQAMAMASILMLFTTFAIFLIDRTRLPGQSHF